MLKISASTWANEAAFCFTETIPSLMQTPGRYLQLGLSPSLSLFMFWLCIINNHSDWDSGETFPDLTLVGRGKKISIYTVQFVFTHAQRCGRKPYLLLLPLRVYLFSFLCFSLLKTDSHPHSHSEKQHCSRICLVTVCCSAISEWENKLKNTVHETRPLSFYSKQPSSSLIAVFLCFRAPSEHIGVTLPHSCHWTLNSLCAACPTEVLV